MRNFAAYSYSDTVHFKLVIPDLIVLAVVRCLHCEGNEKLYWVASITKTYSVWCVMSSYIDRILDTIHKRCSLMSSILIIFRLPLWTQSSGEPKGSRVCVRARVQVWVCVGVWVSSVIATVVSHEVMRWSLKRQSTSVVTAGPSQ